MVLVQRACIWFPELTGKLRTTCNFRSRGIQPVSDFFSGTARTHYTKVDTYVLMCTYEHTYTYTHTQIFKNKNKICIVVC